MNIAGRYKHASSEGGRGKKEGMILRIPIDHFGRERNVIRSFASPAMASNDSPHVVLFFRRSER